MPARIAARPMSSSSMWGIRQAPSSVNSEAKRSKSCIRIASVISPRSASISTRSAIACGSVIGRVPMTASVHHSRRSRPSHAASQAALEQNPGA
jgi:hypothetical protein